VTISTALLLEAACPVSPSRSRLQSARGLPPVTKYWCTKFWQNRTIRGCCQLNADSRLWSRDACRTGPCRNWFIMVARATH